jgi:hypothetical protein
MLSFYILRSQIDPIERREMNQKTSLKNFYPLIIIVLAMVIGFAIFLITEKIIFLIVFITIGLTLAITINKDDQ